METDREHHVAVRGGVLIVREGRFVEVVTREAVGEDTLEALGAAVLERMREEERRARARALPAPASRSPRCASCRPIWRRVGAAWCRDRPCRQ